MIDIECACGSGLSLSSSSSSPPNACVARASVSGRALPEVEGENDPDDHPDEGAHDRDGPGNGLVEVDVATRLVLVGPDEEVAFEQRRQVEVLRVQRQDEGAEADDRDDDVEEHVPRRLPALREVADAGDARHHVDQDRDHREQRRLDDEAAEARGARPEDVADPEGESVGHDARAGQHRDHRQIRRLVLRMDTPEVGRCVARTAHREEHARGVVRGGGTARDHRVDQGEGNDPRAGRTPVLVTERVPVGATGRLVVTDDVHLRTDVPRVRHEHVEQADEHARADHAQRHGAPRVLRLFAERRGSLEADERQDREHRALEDARPAVRAFGRRERRRRVRLGRDHVGAERHEHGDLDGTQDDRGLRRHADVEEGQAEDGRRRRSAPRTTSPARSRSPDPGSRRRTSRRGSATSPAGRRRTRRRTSRPGSPSSGRCRERRRCRDRRPTECAWPAGRSLPRRTCTRRAPRPPRAAASRPRSAPRCRSRTPGRRLAPCT